MVDHEEEMRKLLLEGIQIIDDKLMEGEQLKNGLR